MCCSCKGYRPNESLILWLKLDTKTGDLTLTLGKVLHTCSHGMVVCILPSQEDDHDMYWKGYRHAINYRLHTS